MAKRDDDSEELGKRFRGALRRPPFRAARARRRYSKDDLDRAFSLTDGRCHLCAQRLERSMYAVEGPDGWQMDHSKPISRGGSDSWQNWRVAHTACNAAKGTMSARAFREKRGVALPVSSVALQRMRGELHADARRLGASYAVSVGVIAFLLTSSWAYAIGLALAAGAVGWAVWAYRAEAFDIEDE